MRLAPIVLALAVLALALLGVGCEDYADTVACSRGTVLNEHDECVPPPTPDGGVEIVSCAALCTAAAEWDTDQIGCLTGMIGMFGAPPDVCMGDLTDGATCNACVGSAGATDDICATAGATCQ